MFSTLIGKTRQRWSLIPAATKGWNPSKFASVSHALEFAVASKRMKFSWLAEGTRIPIDRLKAAIRSKLELSAEETRKMELYLGVNLRKEIVDRVRRAPP